MYKYIIDKATRTGTAHERRGNPNEDRHFVYQENGCIWMGVFDGVSQGGGGGQAASLALESMESILEDSLNKDIHYIGLSIMESAQEAILDAQVKHPEYGALQSTGAIACINLINRSLTWFSIGDSAVFVCPRKKLPIKLTTEDTDIGERLSQGRISRNTALKATVGHELKRWLGMDITPKGIRRFIRTGTRPLDQDDIIMVCSDGFYSKMPPRLFNRLVWKREDAKVLAKKAKDLGSQDDITIIYARPIAEKPTMQIHHKIAIAVLMFSLVVLCGVVIIILLKEKSSYARLISQWPVIETFTQMIC